MIKIEKLTNNEDISGLINVVKKYFKTVEKPHYTIAEFISAENNLSEFKELNEMVLSKLITSKSVQTIILKENETIIGGSVIELRSGRILFMVSLANDRKQYKMLTDAMTKVVSNHATANSLKILAFVGQSDILNAIGYKYIYKDIYYNYGVKVRALIYTINQLDNEL